MQIKLMVVKKLVLVLLDKGLTITKAMQVLEAAAVILEVDLG